MTDPLDHFKALYPGFHITCAMCGSSDVIVTNSMAWSELSGGWGSVDLLCDHCSNTTVIATTHDD